MMFPALWNHSWTPQLINHLWQSTAVTGLVALLVFTLRRNPASIRYRLWMLASVKFLLPFSLLILGGQALRSSFIPPANLTHSAGTNTVQNIVRDIALPFPQTSDYTVDFDSVATQEPITTRHIFWPDILVAVWLVGVSVIFVSWTRQWLRVRQMLRKASPVSSPVLPQADVPILSAPGLLEPSVCGVFRPVLLLPETIAGRLSARQLEAVIAHEMCHVRRRDNLTAAMHMLVKALFWFHPAVWWIESRLLEERERACDEAVLACGNEAELYAESILEVCKSYVESPMACVSGITGSELKQRIVRIMSETVVHKLDLRRKLMLGVAGATALAVPLTLGLMHLPEVHAQTSTAKPSKDLTGDWQGTLHAGRDLRTIIKITKAQDGSYKGILYSIDQSGDGIPFSTITFDGETLKYAITAIGGSYEGKLSADGNSIDGNWHQGPTPRPLVLTRTTPATEWTIPPPTPKIPPMDANADPSFEVATIKPSKPDEKRRGIMVNGRQMHIVNQTLELMMSFSYGVHPKQIVGLPPWASTDKFDIDAQPDGQGAPNDKQWKGMIRKMLADRFQLALHHDKKELSVYVLSVTKSGEKMSKSQGDPNGLPGLFFRGRLGDLTVGNANMGDFVNLLQEVVLDRPVIDQTGLSGRFDFILQWTPDDSQFNGEASHNPPSTDNTNPPPNLYTAIQEQIGLKLDATRAPADVLVIDKVEKPSDN